MFIEFGFFDDLQDAAPNATVTINGEIPHERTSYDAPCVIEITAPVGKVFTGSQGRYDPNDGDYQSFEIIGDGSVIKRDFGSEEFDPYYWEFTLVEVGEPEPEPEPEPLGDFEVKQSYLDYLTVRKVTLYIDNVVARVGDIFNYPFVAKMTVDNSLLFSSYFSFDYYDVEEGVLASFIPSPDKKTITLEFTASDGFDIEKFDIETVIDETVAIPKKVAYNDVFILTPTQARVIATTQFSYMTSDKGGSAIVKPQGSDVIGFIELPVVVDPSLIMGVKRLMIGTSNTGIDASFLNIDQYVIDMGIISVPKLSDNILDFYKTIAVLHLPYTNPINLDIDYVMGETIGITYNVNLYDGIASVNITSTKLNAVVTTKSIKLNINVPFGKPDDNPMNNTPYNIDFGIENGVMSPYIEILRNDAILENGFFTIPMIDESVLNAQIGFVKVDEIELKTTATNSEKSDILSLLKSGVIIND